MDFIWDDSFNTGDSSIDSQHHIIFDATHMFTNIIRQLKTESDESVDQALCASMEK
ncbi:MAG: hypothetical protein OQK24_00695 [Magnetovibrio sp.]|nr:hypothetical protein [Magnetovibrio sp.]